MNGADNIVDDEPGTGQTGTKQKCVAEAFAAFTDCSVHLILLVERGAVLDQVEVGCTFPMRVEAIEKGLGIDAVIKFRQIMRKGSILQPGLVAANKHPIIIGSK